MPYTIDWYIEKQVIYGEIWGEQTIEELQDSNRDMNSFLDQSEGRLVHIILRSDKLEKVPASIAQMQKILTYSKHPHLGWVMIVGEREKTIKENAQDFVMLLLAKITRARYMRLKTFDEAVKHLDKVDSTIDWNATIPNMHEKASQL